MELKLATAVLLPMSGALLIVLNGIETRRYIRITVTGYILLIVLNGIETGYYEAAH